jgi:hypothetical protein
MSQSMTPEQNIARVLAGGDAPEAWGGYALKAEAILAEMKRREAERQSIFAETDEYIDVGCIGPFRWRDSRGMWISENQDSLSRAIVRADDYRVCGEVWRVHKGDADPFPSRPHAHCVGGAKKLRNCKLHLGTARLYRGKEPLGFFLAQKQFDRLIDLIRPKFPDITLPLPMS